MPISSIGDAAKKLRAIQRNWAHYPFAQHRRAALIADKLPKVSARPLTFGAPAPTAPLGSWTLVAPDMMLASPSCSSPFPNGETRFVEDKTAPSRAYLKLWELFTRIGTRPQPGEICLDLGSSPGGWTFVLQKLGARVLSADKVALDASVAQLPGVSSIAVKAPSRSIRRRSGRSIGCSRTSCAIRSDCWAWCRSGGKPARSAASSARSNSRERPTSRRCATLRPFRDRSFCTSITTSTS
jgi:hypothetical protein